LKFLVFSLIVIIVNAFVISGINSPSSRFQARVLWLLPLALLIIYLADFRKIPKTAD
jgi:uncharacterized membrane protein YtjA (UPF0391 family)